MLLGHLCESMADLEAALRTGRLELDEQVSRAGGDPVEALRDRAAEVAVRRLLLRRPGALRGGGRAADPALRVARTGAVEIAVHGWDVSAAVPGLAVPVLAMKGTSTTSLEEKAEVINKEGQHLLAGINVGLKLYRWYPSVFLSSFNDPASYSFESGTNTETEYQEKLAVETLLEYMADGKIGWFRRCADCSRWFIAATEHQKYCSTKCRVRNHSESDEFKRKRARYMRLKYRPNLKRAEETAKRQAVSVRGQ